MKSRLLSIVLILTMLPFSLCAVQGEETKEIAVVKFMQTIGVLEGDNNGELRLEDTITRAEMAVIASKVMQSDIRGADVEFADVPKEHWAYEYIANAVQMDIFKGDSNNMFRPDENVTYNEVYAIIARLLQYDSIAGVWGGYPQGYVTLMDKLDIFGRDFNAMHTSEATRWGVIYLMYRALGTNCGYDYEPYNEDMQIPNPDSDTMLKKYMNIEYSRGQVDANEFSGLNGKKTGANSISISGISYDINDIYMADYLGYFVEYYYRENEIVFMYPLNEDKSFTILSEDIEEIEDDYILYYEGDRTKKFKLEDTYQLIYNGAAEPYSKDYLNIEQGDITFVKNLKNEYSVVIVNSYLDYVVSATDAENQIIYDKFGNEPIELENKDISIRVLNKEYNNEIDALMFSENTVLNIRKSLDGRIISMWVCKDSDYTGKISSVGEDDEGKKFIRIDGAELKLSQHYMNALEEKNPEALVLNLEMNVKVHLNKFGYVVYAEETESQMQYGYLLKAWIEEEDEEQLGLKIFDENGACRKLYAHEKVSFNGERNANKYYILSELTAQQLICFKVTDGKIKEIETAVNGFSEEKFSLDKTYRTATLSGQGIFNNTHYITEKSKIFLIDRIAQEITEENIKIGKVENFVSNIKYDILIYDADDNNHITAGVFSYNPVIISDNTNTMIIESIELTLNKYDEAVYRLVGYTGMANIFNYEEIYTAENVAKGNVTAIYKQMPMYCNEITDISQLKPGDIIEYSLNKDGEIEYFNPVFIYNREYEHENGRMLMTASTSYNYRGGGTKSYFGNLYKADKLNYVMKIKTEEFGEKLESVLNFRSRQALKFDTKTKKISLLTPDYLTDYYSTRNKEQEIFIKTSGIYIRQIVLYE